GSIARMYGAGQQSRHRMSHSAGGAPAQPAALDCMTPMVELDFPIIDAHVHLWDPTRFRYAWLEQYPELRAPRSLDDLGRETRELEIDASVVIQADVDPAQAAEECEWVVDLAERDPRVGAMIAWAPVENGAAVRKELDRLTRSRLVKGVRRIIQFEADPSFCVRTQFVEGVSCLADYGLCFDICVAQRQLPAALTLAASCPRVPFVLDHAGKPDIRGGELANWRSLIQRFGELPHVFCKLSGLIAQADHRAWT